MASIFSRLAGGLARLDSYFSPATDPARLDSYFSPATDPARPSGDTRGGWHNPFTGMGYATHDAAQSTGFAAPTPLTQQQATDLYRGSMLARRICSVPPSDATRAGWDVQWDGGDVDALLKKADEIPTHKEGARGLGEAIRRWLTWYRLYGGAVIVLICGDTADTSLPLDEANPRFQELRVLSRYEIDPPRGQGEVWGEVGTGRRWHRSRLLVIGRSSLPSTQATLTQGWDDSILSVLYHELAAVGTAQRGALQALTLQGLAVRKISGLAAMLSRGGGELAARMGLESLMRGAYRTVLLDADKEGYDFAAPSLASLPDLMDRFPQALAAAAGVPPHKLLGAPTGGLSNEDKTAERSYLDDVMGEIAAPHALPAAQRLYSLLARTLSPASPDPVVTARPLWTPSPLEEAEAMSKQADVVDRLVSAGILPPSRVKIWSEGGQVRLEVVDAPEPPVLP